MTRPYGSGVAEDSKPYRLGQVVAGAGQPLVYGVVITGLGVPLLPWGDPAAFVLLAALVVTGLVKNQSDRAAPVAFAAMTLLVCVYILGDFPRSAWTSGFITVAIVWAFTGTRAKWARYGSVFPAALFVAALLGMGDATVLTGQTPTVGHEINEVVRLLLLLLLGITGPVLRAELERVEKEKDAAVEAAATNERARIARELHDVVAHHVTVMVLQAEGAKASSTDPKAATALGQVIAAGRTALNELRRLLGVLKQGEGEADLEPQPDLSRLPALIEQLSGAGLDVDLAIDGEPGTVAPGVALSGYRIVQEALTNSLRHSGGEQAHVRVAYATDSITLEVIDEGGTRMRFRGGTGRGLIGMQEWAAAVGGTVEAGPAPTGGYTVLAKLPRK